MSVSFNGKFTNAGRVIARTPVEPLPGKLVLSLKVNDQGDIYDATGKTLNLAGSIASTTAVTKWGTRSIYFDGSGGKYITLPAQDDFVFGMGDFTIEAWVYLVRHGSLADFRPPGTNGSYPTFDTFSSYTTNTGTRIANQTPALNAWHHYALTSVGGVIRTFVDGKTNGQTYTTVTPLAVGRVSIGLNAFPITDSRFYLDGLQMIKGYGRYTTDFSVPTAPF